MRSKEEEEKQRRRGLQAAIASSDAYSKSAKTKSHFRSHLEYASNWDRLHAVL